MTAGHRHPGGRCWNCHSPLNASSGYGGVQGVTGSLVSLSVSPAPAVQPTPGDWTFCLYCNVMSVFAEDLTLREPTIDELADATRDPLVRAVREGMAYADRVLARMDPAKATVKRKNLGYRNPACAPRDCDYCGETYTGPAVVCCLRCAIESA